ncbi:MAG: polysaccharide export protein [Ahrensia sp.]|nr:polysaccharide export protein [Ahrensia sp.]
MNRRGFLVTCLSGAAALSALSGCATAYNPPAAAFHEILQKPYRLDAGDQLRITVFEQEELTNTYQVDKAGYIAFPLVGAVPARGHTIKDVERTVAQKLAEGFIRNPDVSVEVNRYRPFFIMGEVSTGGQYTYVPGMTVQNAIAIAGGYTARADQQTVDITRSINGKVLTGRVPITDPIMPSDTIHVRERVF